MNNHQMTQDPENIQIFSKPQDSIPHLQKFSHQAMATTFEIFIQSDDPGYAKKGALAAFEELDSFEQQLSRYIENSDISRINNLSCREIVRVGLSAFECLSIAKDIYSQTNGAFDISIGLLYDCWLDEKKKIRKTSPDKLALARQNTGTHFLELDQNEHTVKLISEKICVDLGGIGKGYALDHIAQILQDWSIDKALIHGGFSTLLAMNSPSDKKGWPITVSNPTKPEVSLEQLCLVNRSFSVSGVQKGQHIIDPSTTMPVQAKISAWACAETATIADALSTAFMVMSLEEIEKYCHHHPQIFAAIMPEYDPDKVCYFGPWDQCRLFEK
jgi:thiamine biosynthesis lipoprotein